MNKEKLKTHVKRCKKNLKYSVTKCCANCPFEEEICEEYPDMVDEFEHKRFQIAQDDIIEQYSGVFKRLADM